MANDMRLNDKPIAKDGAYIYAEAADGSQVKISKADLASVVAGQMKFYSGKISGTQVTTNATELAKEVINAIPLAECTFNCIYNYQGNRSVRGFVYGNKQWGLVIIEEYSGHTVKVSLMSGEYNVVE